MMMVCYIHGCRGWYNYALGHGGGSPIIRCGESGGDAEARKRQRSSRRKRGSHKAKPLSPSSLTVEEGGGIIMMRRRKDQPPQDEGIVTVHDGLVAR